MTVKDWTKLITKISGISIVVINAIIELVQKITDVIC